MKSLSNWLLAASMVVFMAACSENSQKDSESKAQTESEATVSNNSEAKRTKKRSKQVKAVNPKNLSNNVKLVSQAYLYGYPMLTMHYTHIVSTNVKTNNGMGKAPINQWAGMRKFPKAGFTAVVRPNLDTYYSLIYADLSEDALYLHIPATERYYLVPILNAYGDVIASVGSRTTGQEALDIAFVGPNYKGEIPNDLKVIRSNTSLNWVLGRVAVKNDKDGKDEVKNFQNKLIAVPLSERNNPNYKMPKGKVNPKNKFVPMDKVDGLDIETYMNEMMALWVNNPAQKGDEKLVAQLATIGITPGGKFDLSQFSEEDQAAIKQIPAMVQQQFAATTQQPRPEVMQNGWMVNTSGLGEYGTNYAMRAYITKIGYGANQAVDAVYPNSAVDSDGNNYDGKYEYVLHFEKKDLPPVKGFWSITMYNKKGFLVDNTIDRYNLGDMKNLKYNEDGSLDIYIAAEAPEGHEANWLPSTPPGEEFELTFRMYWPKEPVLDRTWTMPGVRKIKFD